MGLIPGLGRSPGEKNGHPLQHSCPENPMERGAQWATTAWPNPRARDFTLKFQNAEYTLKLFNKPLGIPPHPVPSNSQRQRERECRALFSVIMSRQDLTWPAGHDENGKQMASKFPPRGARSVERGRKRPPHPHPLPFQSCQTFPLFYFLSHWD